MLRVLRLLLALWLLVVLQTTIVPHIRVLDARPDLPLLLILLTALHEGPAGGALAGFVGGLFVDLSSPGALGLTSLIDALVAFGIGSLGGRLVRGSLTTRIVVALVATLVRDLALVLAGAPDELVRALFRAIIPGAIYTALVAVPVMALLEKVVGWGEESWRGRS
ncbi:MAG: rod shape-determining protein MreD [Candidatus Eiseniibacteriota bacterium]